MSLSWNRKAKLRFRLFLCLLLGHGNVLYAQYTFSPTLQNSYLQVLDLRIHSARQLLSTATGRDTEAYQLLVENYADVAELLVTDDPQRLEVLDGHEDARLSRLDELPRSTHREFIKGSIIWQWALVKLKNGNELRAAWGIRKSYLIFEGIEKDAPQFMAHKPALGALKVMIGSVPEKYSWILSTFGLHGTIEEGMRLWKASYDSESVFRKEADLFLQTFQAFSTSNGSQRKEVLTLLDRNPKSLLAYFICTTYLMKSHEDRAAGQLLDKVPRGEDYLDLSYLHIIKGELRLRAGEPAEAIPHFKLYLKTYSGRFYRHDIYFRLALAEHLRGNDAMATQYLKRIPELSAPKTDADRAALQVAESGKLPDRNLSRLRLLTDGGHYEKAIALLSSIDRTEVSDTVELEYRKARLLDLTGRTAEAEKSYRLVIYSGNGPHGYIRPNACLQLAYIYMEAGKEEAAETMLRKVLDFDDYPYKASLDNKAKTAMSQLTAAD